MILIVEDCKPITKLLEKQIVKYIPEADISCVCDAENASKALMGENYEEYVPKFNSFKRAGPHSFVAAIWDNSMPETPSAPPEFDVGFNTVAALRTSRKVSEEVLSHFISHSSDNHAHLVDSGCFARVYTKPMNQQQLEEFRDLFREWRHGV